MNMLTGVLVGVASAALVQRCSARLRLPRRVVVPAGRRWPRGPLHVRALDPIRRRIAATRRRPLAIGAVVEWCDAIGRQVRSGETLREAVRMTVPPDAALAETTAPIRNGLDRGQPLTVAIAAHRAAAPDGIGDLDLALAAIEAAAELGGSAAGALDRVAMTLRLRAADRQERAAHSAQARLSAHVLTLVPVGVLAILVTTDPAIRSTLASAFGAAAITVGLGLNVAGWWWMRRIIRGAP